MPEYSGQMFGQITNQKIGLEKLGAWLGEAWELFSKEWLTWVLMMLTMVAIVLIAVVPLIIFSAVLDAGRSAEEGPSGASFVLSFVFQILEIFLNAFLLAGVFRTAFRQLRGLPISVAGLFSGGDVFLRVAGAQFLISLVMVVLALFFVPIIIMLVKSGVGLLVVVLMVLVMIPVSLVVNYVIYFATQFIVERQAGVLSALQQGLSGVFRHFLVLAALSLLFFVLAIIGMIPCLLGLLVVAPLYFLALTVAFRDLFGLSGAGALAPAAPATPPAYAPQAQPWMPAPPTPPANLPRYAPPPPTPFVTEVAEQLPPTQVIQPPAPPVANPPAAPLPPAATLTCPHCQAVLQRAANFCNYCGQSLRGPQS